MNKKISIIISAYNTEKYIEKCISSITNQTYKDLEIIVIDDASSDDTLKKLKNIKDKRLKILSNKENSGLSFSRNKGIKESTGDYVSFIDSDDYIPENFYEELMKTMEKEKSDIVVCDINTIYENNGNNIRQICGKKDGDKIDFINKGLAASACNKLFKKDIINKYQFSVGKVNEDLAVILPCIIEANKVSYNENTYYNYIQRGSSLQNSAFSEKRFDIFYGVDLTLERIKNVKDYKKYKDAIVYNQLIMLLVYVIPKETDSKKRKIWLKKYHDLIQKYDIKNNIFLVDFYKDLSYKQSVYYKKLIDYTVNGNISTANLIIDLYTIYRKYRNKKVTKDNLTIKDLVDISVYQSKLPKNKKTISVVIPNYNYEKYLLERLYSVLNQKIKIDEVIILDDCSSDNSRKLIDELIKRLSKYINISKVYNEKNSGSTFKQWQKGFNLANSDYVWIAEADDYCDSNFLKKVFNPMIKNEKILISYSDTAFIDADGKIMMSSIKPEIDIMKTGHWDKSYINDGKDEFKNYSFLNCTIANVSSVVFKKDNYDDLFKLSGNFKQAGDWLLYVNIMQRGLIAYYNKPLNYYRVHGNNVSSVTKKDAHLKEIKRIHKFYDEKYGLNKKQKNEIEKRYKFLTKVWNLDRK